MYASNEYLMSIIPTSVEAEHASLQRDIFMPNYAKV